MIGGDHGQPQVLLALTSEVGTPVDPDNFSHALSRLGAAVIAKLSRVNVRPGERPKLLGPAPMSSEKTMYACRLRDRPVHRGRPAA
jgi:hypothetical protein